MLTAYRKKVTVRQDGRIEIKDPTFKAGTKAEVIVLVERVPDNDRDRQELVQKWKALFAETQALPQAKVITEAEIAAEIAAYRAEKK